MKLIEPINDFLNAHPYWQKQLSETFFQFSTVYDITDSRIDGTVKSIHFYLGAPENESHDLVLEVKNGKVYLIDTFLNGLHQIRKIEISENPLSISVYTPTFDYTDSPNLIVEDFLVPYQPQNSKALRIIEFNLNNEINILELRIPRNIHKIETLKLQLGEIQKKIEFAKQNGL